MCYAIPGIIREIQGEEAIVDYGGVTKRVNISLVPEPRVGDYVLVHAGFAIERLDPKAGGETLEAMGGTSGNTGKGR